MKHLFLLFSLVLIGFTGRSQNHAVYLTRFFDIDVMETTFTDDSIALQKAYSFGGSINAVPSTNEQFWHLNSWLIYPERFQLTYADSVNLNGVWHRISGVFFSDDFPYDQDDEFYACVKVEGLGTIYKTHGHNKASYYDDNDLFFLMLSINDSKKQRLLKLVYQKLSSNAVCAGWINWGKCVDLVSELNDSNCFQSLSRYWLENKNDLKIVDQITKLENNELHYSVTIVNQSKRAYFFRNAEGREHFSQNSSPLALQQSELSGSTINNESFYRSRTVFGPSYRTITNTDDPDNPSEKREICTDCRCGLPNDTILQPGDTMVFVMKYNNAWKTNETVTYDGFQFYNGLILVQTLFQSPLSVDGVLYRQRRYYGPTRLE